NDLGWAFELGQAIGAWQRFAAAPHTDATQASDVIAATWRLRAAQLQGATENATLKNPPAGKPGTAPATTGVIVLRPVGGTSETSTGREAAREFKAITGKRLPLVAAQNIVRVRAILRDEFPHLHRVVDVLLTGLVEGEPVRLPPTLLVGEPGGGKSRLARRL